jgi:hypothetical protein
MCWSGTSTDNRLTSSAKLHALEAIAQESVDVLSWQLFLQQVLAKFCTHPKSFPQVMCPAFHFSLCPEVDQRFDNGLTVRTAEFPVRSETVIDFHPLISCLVVVLMLQRLVGLLRSYHLLL